MRTFSVFEGSISFCYLTEEQNNTWETCIRKVRSFNWNRISESVKEGSWCKIIKHEYWNRECGISFAKTQHWFQYHDGLSLSPNFSCKKPPPPTSFSPVTSTKVGFGPRNFLTFSFNTFAPLVQNFKFVSSASPKLLNLKQDHPSKKAIFLVKSL